MHSSPPYSSAFTPTHRSSFSFPDDKSAMSRSQRDAQPQPSGPGPAIEGLELAFQSPLIDLEAGGPIAEPVAPPEPEPEQEWAEKPVWGYLRTGAYAGAFAAAGTPFGWVGNLLEGAAGALISHGGQAWSGHGLKAMAITGAATLTTGSVTGLILLQAGVAPPFASVAGSLFAASVSVLGDRLSSQPGEDDPSAEGEGELPPTQRVGRERAAPSEGEERVADDEMLVLPVSASEPDAEPSVIFEEPEPGWAEPVPGGAGVQALEPEIEGQPSIEHVELQALPVVEEEPVQAGGQFMPQEGRPLPLLQDRFA